MDKNKKYFYAVICFFCLMLFSVKAIAAPTPQMAREVIDYYYNGQKEGPILMDAKLCRKIEALECIEELPSGPVKLGETIAVWMKFLVPKDTSYDDILVEYKYGDTPWHVTSYKLESSIRYRIIDKYEPPKPGKWTITIKKGSEELQKIFLSIVKNTIKGK